MEHRRSHRLAFRLHFSSSLFNDINFNFPLPVTQILFRDDFSIRNFLFFTPSPLKEISRLQSSTYARHLGSKNACSSLRLLSVTKYIMIDVFPSISPSHHYSEDFIFFIAHNITKVLSFFLLSIDSNAIFFSILRNTIFVSFRIHRILNHFSVHVNHAILLSITEISV